MNLLLCQGCKRWGDCRGPESHLRWSIIAEGEGRFDLCDQVCQGATGDRAIDHICRRILKNSLNSSEVSSPLTTLSAINRLPKSLK